MFPLYLWVSVLSYHSTGEEIKLLRVSLGNVFIITLGNLRLWDSVGKVFKKIVGHGVSVKFIRQHSLRDGRAFWPLWKSTLV